MLPNKGVCKSGIKDKTKRVITNITVAMILEKVIFVGHGMAFRALNGIEQMQPAEIIEWEYN